jgi:NitT/TauT family transport system permease protein
MIRIFHVPTYILPAPSKVAIALWRGFATGLYPKHLLHTLTETLLGFLLGSLLGLLIGTAVALNRYVEYFFYPYIVMFQSVPKVALAPLIVVWFGLGLMSQVMNAALVACFPLIVNTIAGLKSADEDRINLMRSLAASKSQVFWMLKLPSALPFVMAGVEVAMIFALIGAIVAEFVGSQAGLGMLIQSMNFNMDVAGQFSVLLILAIVGLLLNRCIFLIRRRVLFWDPSVKQELEQERTAL